MNSTEIRFYTNPATDHITIPIEPNETASIEIHDAFGRVVNRSEINSIQQQVDISHLPPVLYIADVRSGDKRWLGKFVKE